jgi:hypothetical protein
MRDLFRVMNNSNERRVVEEPTECFLYEYMRVARDGLNVRRKVPVGS